MGREGGLDDDASMSATEKKGGAEGRKQLAVDCMTYYTWIELRVLRGGDVNFKLGIITAGRRNRYRGHWGASRGLASGPRHRCVCNVSSPPPPRHHACRREKRRQAAFSCAERRHPVRLEIMSAGRQLSPCRWHGRNGGQGGVVSWAGGGILHML